MGCGVLATLQSIPSAGQVVDDSWTLVALPDTQKYANDQDRATYATDQTDWIVDNLTAESIRFVTHEGDLVDDGSSETQWDRIDGAMSTLDGEVPYSTVPGNHDWAVTNDKSSSIANYTDYFGPSRFDGRSWYGGSGPNAEETNSYQLFSAGGYEFLHLGLEWEPSGSVTDASTPLGWAQQVLDKYPGRPTILTTHSYLRDDGSRATAVQDANNDGSSGETVWEELVKQNPQIFLVLNGHWHEDDGEYHQTSMNAAGLTVYEIIADYQDRLNGGNGWLRLVRFEAGSGSEGADRIHVRSYSPSLDEYETDADSNFTFDLDFADRFNVSADDIVTVSFQQGADGYDGTADTNLREAQPETSFASAETVTVDMKQPQSSDNSAQALLRFNGLFGAADGQIPTGATIQSAKLSVETVDNGDGGTVHRMLREWGETDTWSSVGGGIQADGTDAVETAESETGAVPTGLTTIEVTESLQQWTDGRSNYGWALLPLGDDGWDFETSEGATPPQLTVRYEPPVDGDADGDGDVDADDVDRMQRHVANYDVDIDEGAADVDEDGDVDIGDIVRVVDDIGGGG